MFLFHEIAMHVVYGLRGTKRIGIDLQRSMFDFEDNIWILSAFDR